MSREPAPGSAEADALEVLATLVEDYETKRFPIAHPDPIEAIRFRMEQQGLTQKDLAQIIGSPSRVSEILARKRPLTLSMIRALHSSLGIPAESLLQEQVSPDPYPQLLDWNRFPFREMAKNGYFAGHVSSRSRNPENIIREFVEPHFRRRGTYPLFKRTLTTGKAADKYALAAWTMRVVTRARERPLTIGFRQGTFGLELMREVAQLSWSAQGPLLAQEFLERRGVPVVIEPHLTHTRLDGAAILADDKRPIVGLTLRYDRLDSFWFSLMHELAHIALHLRTGQTFYDDFDSLDNERDDQEHEADRLAREALIPSEVWAASPARLVRSQQAAQRLAERLRIHPSIVVGRMQYETRDFRILGHLLGRGEVRQLFPHSKWRDKAR